MSMSLYFSNENAEDRSSVIWKEICEISNHGITAVSRDTLNSICKYLDGKILTNGESITAYAYDEDYDPMLCTFGPCLLHIVDSKEVRTLLAADDNAEAALKLFDYVVKNKIQFSADGGSDAPGYAYIKAVNWMADTVDINRSNSAMHHMMKQLGFETDDNGGESTLEEFEKAVEANMWNVDYSVDRLRQFIECAKRNNATLVYWA